MNPEHHRQVARLLRRDGRIDVQVQAILIRTGVEKQIVLPDMPLLATGAELCRIAHALPRRGRLRSLPAQFANGRRRVGQTKKGISIPLSIHLPAASPWEVFTVGCETAASTIQPGANTQPATAATTKRLRFFTQNQSVLSR